MDPGEERYSARFKSLIPLEYFGLEDVEKKPYHWTHTTSGSHDSILNRTFHNIENSPMNSEKTLREHLLELLGEGHAHVPFDDVVNDFPQDLLGKNISGIPYTPWQLFEHIRISQWDILEFSRDASHVSPKWPEGYWPTRESPEDKEKWERSVAAFQADLSAMRKLVADPSRDLYARIPHGDGQTILREALVLADHNAYHLGQLVLLKRLLGAWEDR